MLKALVGACRGEDAMMGALARVGPGMRRRVRLRAPFDSSFRNWVVASSHTAGSSEKTPSTRSCRPSKVTPPAT